MRKLSVADLYWLLRNGTKTQRADARDELLRRGENV
jgi:hypothetical protein